MADAMTDTLAGTAPPRTAVTRMLSEMDRFLALPDPA
jgi:multiple sugar transport system substrate-binding protein